MAITAHYMLHSEKGQLIYKTALIAFRYIEGSHSGEHLSQEYLRITDALEISQKVIFHSIISWTGSNGHARLDRSRPTMHQTTILFSKR